MSKYESHQSRLGDLSLKDRNSHFARGKLELKSTLPLTVREQTPGQNSSSDLTQEQERMNETSELPRSHQSASGNSRGRMQASKHESPW